MTELPKLMTAEEVAEALRSHPKTIRKRAEAGEIPYTIIGKRMRFLASDIEDIIYRNYRK